MSLQIYITLYYSIMMQLHADFNYAGTVSLPVHNDGTAMTKLLYQKYTEQNFASLTAYDAVFVRFFKFI
jgi:hypothetical protein